MSGNFVRAAEVSSRAGFDLLAFAREHRYRVRNLHDGLPVPPMRPKRPAGFRPAYVAEADRLDAIIGRFGYVTVEGDRLGWALLCKSTRSLKPKLMRLELLPGVRVCQEGTTEAAGDASVEAIDALLDVLRVYRRKPASSGGRFPPLGEGARRVESTQADSGAQESAEGG